VLPLLLPGVKVDALQIALSLIVTMLVPLLIGLFIKARYEGAAQTLQPVMAQISTISLALLMVLMLGLNFKNVIALFGTGAIIATILFLVISLLAGYLLGGPGTDTKRVLALGTGQRNLSAAFIIAAGNFADQPNVLVYVAAAGLVGMVVLFPTAGEFGKPSKAAPESDQPAVSGQSRQPVVDRPERSGPAAQPPDAQRSAVLPKSHAPDRVPPAAPNERDEPR
jgi:BASS family bile acid:Na+ symporter